MPIHIDRDRGTTLHYEHAGEGFPLLLLPPGGLTADIAYWQRVAFNAFEIFQRGFHAIGVDERHAGRSSGPIELDDPWGAYARDHLGLMNHLGIERFHVLGSCIGCSHALRLIQLAPERVVSAVLVQPTGIDEESKKVLHGSREGWEQEMLAKRPELDRKQVAAFGEKVWTGEFVLSVTRDWVKTCPVPLLVLPGVDAGHPNAIGKEVAALAPRAEVLEPWKTPLTLIPSTIQRIRTFLDKQTPL
ncbi:MAG TPA: alpha/beta hydrolase [Burkholderiales bacterium]|nr:alpha/beta hydrolase [Burkholderiales bacterium]